MSAQPDTTVPLRTASNRRPRGRSADPNSPLHPRMVLARVREHDAVRLRARGEAWADIAEALGLRSASSALEACRRGLARLEAATSICIEMLSMQMEQVIFDVRSGALDPKRADVMMRGIWALATLKGVERKRQGRQPPVPPPAEAERRVADVEQYQRRLAVLSDRVPSPTSPPEPPNAA